jgi:hypothetical protein
MSGICSAHQHHDPACRMCCALNDELPYNTVIVPRTVRMYNPLYGDNRICECGHPYDRHFDMFEDVDVQDVGCKYCECYTFIEEQSNAK